MSHGEATRMFAESIHRDWSKCGLCGGYGYRTFNCDDTGCGSRPYPHWHNEPCEGCKVLWWQLPQTVAVPRD